VEDETKYIPKSFVDLTEKLRYTLDDISRKITGIENFLRKENMFFGFEMIVDKSANAFISWEPSDENKKYWRLYFIKKDQVGGSLYKRALIEQKINIRIKLYKYIDPFFAEFEKFIDKELEDIHLQID